MKKVYIKPEMRVVEIKRHALLLLGSDPKELRGTQDEYYELG